MDIPTTLVLIVVLLMAGAYIAQPFVAGEGQSAGRRTRSAGTLRDRATLLAERNQTYAALRDLDFDFQTNKVAEQDYAIQRKQLVAEGVEILQMLDHLPPLNETPDSDPIEAAAASLRSGDAPVAAPASGAEQQPAGKKKVCPRCGQKIAAADKFCGKCGYRLVKAK